MSRFTNAIAHNWDSNWVISPGACRKDCCVPHHALDDCEHCSGFGIDDENNDCAHCQGTSKQSLESITDEALQIFDEGSFSRSQCDSCGSCLGGQRYPAHAIHVEAFGPDAKQPNNMHHIEICTDCLIWHANGEEPENWEG